EVLRVDDDGVLLLLLQRRAIAQAPRRAVVRIELDRPVEKVERLIAEALREQVAPEERVGARVLRRELNRLLQEVDGALRVACLRVGIVPEGLGEPEQRLYAPAAGLEPL